jgi:hypothetical protein
VFEIVDVYGFDVLLLKIKNYFNIFSRKNTFKNYIIMSRRGCFAWNFKKS